MTRRRAAILAVQLAALAPAVVVGCAVVGAAIGLAVGVGIVYECAHATRREPANTGCDG